MATSMATSDICFNNASHLAAYDFSRLVSLTPVRLCPRSGFGRMSSCIENSFISQILTLSKPRKDGGHRMLSLTENVPVLLTERLLKWRIGGLRQYWRAQGDIVRMCSNQSSKTGSGRGLISLI